MCWINPKSIRLRTFHIIIQKKYLLDEWHNVSSPMISYLQFHILKYWCQIWSPYTLDVNHIANSPCPYLFANIAITKGYHVQMIATIAALSCPISIIWTPFSYLLTYKSFFVANPMPTCAVKKHNKLLNPCIKRTWTSPRHQQDMKVTLVWWVGYLRTLNFSLQLMCAIDHT